MQFLNQAYTNIFTDSRVKNPIVYGISKENKRQPLSNVVQVVPAVISTLYRLLCAAGFRMYLYDSLDSL